MFSRSKIIGLVAVIMSPIVCAQDDESKLYYGLEIGNGKYETSNTAEDTMLDVGGSFGYQLLRYVSLEARLGLASNDNSSLIGDAQVTRGAALLKLDYVGDHVKAYLGGGYGAVNSDFAGTAVDDDGLVVSVGLELFGTDNTAFAISYTNYERDQAQLDYTVANIGFRHYFGSQF